MKLSDQAVATLMVTLQKCILEQADITETIKTYDFEVDTKTKTLFVSNPPESFVSPVTAPVQNTPTRGSD